MTSSKPLRSGSKLSVGGVSETPGSKWKRLRIRDLSVEVRMGTDRKKILRSVSLELTQGEITALVGESGCGKSLTAFSIMQMLPSGLRMSDGRVELDNLVLSELQERDAQTFRGLDIAMVFQDPLAALNPVRRIGTQMMRPMRHHLSYSRMQARTEATKLLKSVGLPKTEQILRSYPHQLSGGMRQRVLIAMALSCSPTFLLADEPTTALDVVVQEEILQLIKKLAMEQTLGVLLITHDLGVAAEIADSIYVMYAGQIVERGPSRKVLTEPNHPYTRGLLGSTPTFLGDKRGMSPIPGTAHGAWELHGQCSFAPRCEWAKGRCHHEEPELVEFTDNRESACWVFASPGIGK